MSALRAPQNGGWLKTALASPVKVMCLVSAVFFLAAVQKQSSVRVLADGRQLASYQRYYLAGTAYAQARPDVLRIFFSELQKAGVWVKQHPKDAAALLGPVWGLDAEIVEQANSRRSYEVRAVQPSNMGEQQRIADAFDACELVLTSQRHDVARKGLDGFRSRPIGTDFEGVFILQFQQSGDTTQRLSDVFKIGRASCRERVSSPV